MTKSLVNLVGAAVTAGILLLGVLVFALPLLSTANTTMASADDVATQKSTQQAVLDGLIAKSAEIDIVERELAELRRELPESEHVEDVVELAADAARAAGATLTAVRPAEATAFTPRTAAVVAAETGVELAPVASEPEVADGEGSTEDDAPVDEAPAEPAAPEAAAADGPQQVTVTVEFDAADVATLTALLDALRVGPRLVAVTGATVETEEDRVSLIATVQVFFHP